MEGTAPLRSGDNSFALPATNKALTQKVQEYQQFISSYLIKSTIEKSQAVAAAEQSLVMKYEEQIAQLNAEQQQKPALKKEGEEPKANSPPTNSAPKEKKLETISKRDKKETVVVKDDGTVIRA